MHRTRTPADQTEHVQQTWPEAQQLKRPSLIGAIRESTLLMKAVTDESPSVPSPGTLDDSAPDAELLGRVQYQNQQQVIGKLLHDLRNPVHSMRITMELFARVVQPGADTTTLLARAARYVAPAEAALASLSRQTERFATYLGPPLPPACQVFHANEWLAEIAVLLRNSKKALDVAVESEVADDVGGLADRPRLSHAFLQWCLTRPEAALVLRARPEPNGVRLSAETSMRCEDGTGSFTDAQLQALIEAAGGTFEHCAESGIAIVLQRA
jgi:hypothetical protein